MLSKMFKKHVKMSKYTDVEIGRRAIRFLSQGEAQPIQNKTSLLFKDTIDTIQLGCSESYSFVTDNPTLNELFSSFSSKANFTFIFMNNNEDVLVVYSANDSRIMFNLKVAEKQQSEILDEINQKPHITLV
jgi:hypothetical protein